MYLIVKILTESYPAVDAVKRNYHPFDAVSFFVYQGFLESLLPSTARVRFLYVTVHFQNKSLGNWQADQKNCDLESGVSC